MLMRIFSSRCQKKDEDHHEDSHREEAISEEGPSGQREANDDDESSSKHKPPRFNPALQLSKVFSKSKRSTSRRAPKPIPMLHACAFRGDLPGVLEAITSGVDVNEAVDMENLGGDALLGVTALFLAAQKSRTKVAKLLVENGANPCHKVLFSKTNEHCTAAQIAALNMNPALAMYLKKAAKKAKKSGATFDHPTHSEPLQQQGSGARGHMGHNPDSTQGRFAPSSYPMPSAPTKSRTSNEGSENSLGQGYPPPHESEAGSEQRRPQTSTAGSQEEQCVNDGVRWSSFYLNPGYNMDMRSPEIEDEEINLKTDPLVGRREHLRNLLKESAGYE